MIRMRKFFEEIGLQRLWRPVRLQRLQRLMRSMRLLRFLKAQKSLLKTSESSRFLNSAYFDVQKNKVFLQNHEISGLILITFLLEAVEASLCYFFKNWLMKHKSPNLLKPLGTIIHQNSQFYYPSEPFSFHHFNVRHLVHTNLSFVGQDDFVPLIIGLTWCFCSPKHLGHMTMTESYNQEWNTILNQDSAHQVQTPCRFATNSLQVNCTTFYSILLRMICYLENKSC